MPRPNATTTRPSTAPTGTASRPSFQPLPHALYSASGSSRIHPALAKGMSYMNPRMITADDKAAALEKLKPRAKMKSAKEEANAPPKKNAPSDWWEWVRSRCVYACPKLDTAWYIQAHRRKRRESGGVASLDCLWATTRPRTTCSSTSPRTKRFRVACHAQRMLQAAVRRTKTGGILPLQSKSLIGRPDAG